MTFEWYEGAIVLRVFIVIFCLEQRYKRTSIEERLLLLLRWNLFRKCHSASTWSQLSSKFFLNNYKTPWQWHMKDTLQLKILPTCTNVGVEPAPRHLTCCSMLFFLSNKPSFCYSNNFCCNLFTFLSLKDVPLLINFSNVFQPGLSYFNRPPYFP